MKVIKHRGLPETPLAVASGGTGSTTAAGARTALGAAVSGRCEIKNLDDPTHRFELVWQSGAPAIIPWVD